MNKESDMAIVDRSNGIGVLLFLIFHTFTINMLEGTIMTQSIDVHINHFSSILNGGTNIPTKTKFQIHQHFNLKLQLIKYVFFYINVRKFD